MLPKFNEKLLKFNMNDKFKARAFHFMNTDITRNQIIGEWEQNRDIEGFSPDVTIANIRDQLFGDYSIFQNEDIFENYVLEIYHSKFKTTKLSEEQSLALIARSIICCSMHFYVDYTVDESCFQEFLALLSNQKVFHKKQKQLCVRIFGRPTDQQLQKMNHLFEVNEQKHITVKTTPSGTPTFQFIMKNEENWCCITDYLYSGVNLIVKNIERNNRTIANQHVESLVLKCQPTTYLTRMGLGITYLKQKFDSNLMVDQHAYLEKYQSLFYSFQLIETNLQEELFTQLSRVENEEYDQAIYIMNRYLEKTKYFTTISIAGNITTSDDYVISVKRGENLESPNSYSCSVNGVVEAYHKDVTLYEFSDPNDKPSISLNQENFYFENEFNREMTAELGVTQSLSWVMQGITIFQVPSLENNDIPNNLIIDVIGKTFTPFTLDQIRSMQVDAIENKENERIFGYKLDVFENRTEWTKNMFERVIETMHSQKDLISFLFVSVIFLLQMDFSTINDFELNNLKNISFPKENISVLFTVILLIVTLMNLKKVLISRKYKLKKSVSLKSIAKGQYVSSVILNKIGKNEGQKANIVFALLSEIEFLYRNKNR